MGVVRDITLLEPKTPKSLHCVLTLSDGIHEIQVKSFSKILAAQGDLIAGYTLFPFIHVFNTAIYLSFTYFI